MNKICHSAMLIRTAHKFFTYCCTCVYGLVTIKGFDFDFNVKWYILDSFFCFVFTFNSARVFNNM